MRNPYRIDAGSPWFHVLNISGGRSSGYMLRKVLDAHGGELPARTVAVFANTGREREETLSFVRNMGERWGVGIVWLEFGHEATADGRRRYLSRVVDYATASRAGEPYSAMLDVGRLPSSARGGRTCTAMLKVDVIDRYLWRAHGLTKRQTRKVIGFRADEPARWQSALFRECATVYPLVVAGVTSGDVAAYWRRSNFDLGIESARGNCDLCYLKARPNLLATIAAEPERARWWIEAEGRFPGRTFRPRESYADLLAAALPACGNGELARGAADDGQLDLPCFCSD